MSRDPLPDSRTRRPRDSRSTGSTLFTWKNALLGGGMAFLFLAAATGLFMYMRTSGIGPVGSLVAAGVLEEKARVVLSEFESEDETLGRTVTESFRVDLAQSPMLTLVEPDSIGDALARMGLPEDTDLTEQTARELALRDGIPAVIAGEIASLGAGYVLTARLVSASDGAVLASARASSKNPDGLVDAIDEVSSGLRERIGESYTSLRQTPSLAHVTTGSLEALKKYTQAYDARHRDEDSEAAIRLLEEAVEIDSTFALAWRDLSTILDNIHGSWDQQINATEAAYRHRDRLSGREKYLVEASYHADITEDYGQVIQAYESMLRLDPDDAQALNNIGFAYWQMVDFENALIWYQKAHEAAPDVSLHLANVAVANANLGNLEAAAEAYAGLDSFPPNATWDMWYANYLWMLGDEAGARAVAEQVQAEFPNRGAAVWAEGSFGGPASSCTVESKCGPIVRGTDGRAEPGPGCPGQRVGRSATSGHAGNWSFSATPRARSRPWTKRSSASILRASHCSIGHGAPSGTCSSTPVNWTAARSTWIATGTKFPTASSRSSRSTGQGTAPRSHGWKAARRKPSGSYGRCRPGPASRADTGLWASCSTKRVRRIRRSRGTNCISSLPTTSGCSSTARTLGPTLERLGQLYDERG